MINITPRYDILRIDMLLEAFEVHDNLNPKLWDSNMKLKSQVRDKILEIADEFKNFCDIDYNILDIQIVGSNASYNWTKYSDIDVHIITNFESINPSEELISIIFNLKKSQFNDKYEILIYDIPLNIYVEDVKAGAVSNGIYSVLNDEWVKKPEKLTDIEQVDISSTVNKWTDKIHEVIDQNDSERISEAIDTLYLIRKNSIAIDGEFGVGNQLFKELRNLGLVDSLKDALNSAKQHQLSLQ